MRSRVQCVQGFDGFDGFDGFKGSMGSIRSMGSMRSRVQWVQRNLGEPNIFNNLKSCLLIDSFDDNLFTVRKLVTHDR